MSLAESSYKVNFTKDQFAEIPRWSFLKREQGWGLFSDIANAWKANEQTRARMLQSQLIMMTLSMTGPEQFEAWIAEKASLLKGKGEIEAQTEVAKKLMDAIYEAEYKDYLRAHGVDPDAEKEGKKADPPKG